MLWWVLGPTELAAVSLEIALFFIAMSLGIGFSTAITPLAAEADGKKVLKRAKCVSPWIIFMHDFRYSFGLIFQSR
jgi:MATE family multidrug resistance protein